MRRERGSTSTVSPFTTVAISGGSETLRHVIISDARLGQGGADHDAIRDAEGRHTLLHDIFAERRPLLNRNRHRAVRCTSDRDTALRLRGKG